MKVSSYLKVSVMPWRASKIFREEQAELGRYAEIPLPGEQRATLPLGKGKVSYRESIKAKGGEDDIYFYPPNSLEVTIAPVGGGEPLELKGLLGEDITVSRGDPPWSTTVISKFEVTEPGEYLITARAEITDETEPTLLVG
jgi:hypothetical protein